jgi:hypothetical protein
MALVLSVKRPVLLFFRCTGKAFLRKKEVKPVADFRVNRGQTCRISPM